MWKRLLPFALRHQDTRELVEEVWRIGILREGATVLCSSSGGTAVLPQAITRLFATDVGHYLGVLLLFGLIIGSVLLLVYFQISLDVDSSKSVLQSAFWNVFFILNIIAGIAAWLVRLSRAA